MSFAERDTSTTGRLNQKLRTRRAIVEAAVRLVREGRPLSIADVAEAALVSTATAYRYFPNPQSLWVEAAVASQGELSMEAILKDAPAEPAARMDHVVSRVAEIQLGDEALWRATMRAILERWFAQTDVPEEERIPIRGDRRLALTRDALAGLGDVLQPHLHERLIMAVALVFGAEAMISARDVCGLDPDAAKQTMRWAAQALIEHALGKAAAPDD